MLVLGGALAALAAFLAGASGCDADLRGVVARTKADYLAAGLAVRFLACGSGQSHSGRPIFAVCGWPQA
jgi:hypothetical protein